MTLSQTTSMKPRAPRPATSVGQVFALVAGFLALAAIGATIGWTLTDTSGGGTPLASSSGTPAVSSTPSSPPAQSASPTPKPNGLRVPNYAANGVDFITARRQLMAQGIQGLPEFTIGGTGDDTVTRTVPAAGQRMARGQTVKLYVNEPAPQLNVPNEVTKNCNAAGSDVAKTGFQTQYASGRNGVVLSQNPDTTVKTAHWKDVVTLTCGAPTSSASPSAGASTSLTAPSGQPAG